MLNRLHASNITHFVAGSSHLDLTKKIDDESINNIFMGECTVVVKDLKY
jgi:hypothetical protein